MKPKIIILILIAAAAAIGLYRYRAARAESAQAVNTIVLSGNIEAHESLVSFQVPGRIVELPVEEGQWVESGVLLARLEAKDYRQQAELDEAAANVQGAQLKLALAGSRPQEIQAAEEALADARADLAQKQLDFERADKLYREAVGSQQARDQAETNLKRARATVDRLRQQLDQLQEGTRREQIEISRANLRQAEEKARLSRINLSYTELRAPQAGVISVRQAELGEVVTPGTPVVTLADLDHVWLRAYLSESDLGRVRWGQPATLRTDTYPGKSYRGRISFISSQAEFTPKSVQTFKERVTLVYRIKIDVENPNHELKPGMPADATIELKQ